MSQNRPSDAQRLANEQQQLTSMAAQIRACDSTPEQLALFKSLVADESMSDAAEWLLSRVTEHVRSATAPPCQRPAPRSPAPTPAPPALQRRLLKEGLQTPPPTDVGLAPTSPLRRSWGS